MSAKRSVEMFDVQGIFPKQNMDLNNNKHLIPVGLWSVVNFPKARSWREVNIW